MKIKPLKNWVYANAVKQSEARGIVIPDAHQKEEEAIITIISVGEKVKTVRAGDDIVCMPQAIIKYLPPPEIKEEMQGIKIFVEEEHIIAIVGKHKKLN